MLYWGIGESPAGTGLGDVLFALNWSQFSFVK